MHKNTLWFLFVLLIVYFGLIYCQKPEGTQHVTQQPKSTPSESRDLIEEGRTRKKHALYSIWGALAIAYWIKVKLIIVAFFVGSAVFVGLRYLWPNKCSDIHDSPIIYDHPHEFSHPHTIPYSLDHSPHSDHSFSSSNFDPYSAYSGAYSDSPPPSSPPSGPDVHSLKRRSISKQQFPTEERIGDIMFSFLGLDSTACRRRFICEMEFRSRLNPLTSMGFRIVGRAFFEKYTNARNLNGQAGSFMECAAVNPECVFIEQDYENESAEHVEETPQNKDKDSENPLTDDKKEHQADEPEKSPDENNILSNTEDREKQNAANLKAERQTKTRRRRVGYPRDIAAKRMLSQPN